MELEHDIWHWDICQKTMEVSYNGGTPKSSEVMDDHDLVLKPVMTWGPMTFWKKNISK